MNWKSLDWRWIALLVALVLAALVPFGVQNEYQLHVCITAFFYAVLASSWSLLAGYAGQFSFGHMAFMAIGGYASGLLCRYLGLPPLPGIILGTLVAGLVGLLIGVLCLRFKGAYLALFTIAFSEILRHVLLTEIDITRGANGLRLEPLFAGASRVPYYYAMLALFVGSLALMYWLVNSRYGLFLRAIREDEEAAASMGVNIVRYKIVAFVVTSMIAGLAGAFNGHYITIITPNILVLLQMGLVISMAVIGGIESLVAAAIGAIFIELSLELLRQYQEWRMVLFGALLVLTLRFARNGLIYPLYNWLFRRRLEAEAVRGREVTA